MDFLNDKSFEAANKESRDVRNRSSLSNLKFMAWITALANVTDFLMVLGAYDPAIHSFGQPLYFPVVFDANPWAYPVIYILSSFCLVTIGNIAANSTLLLSSMMTFISHEYEVLGLSFEGSIDEFEQPDKATEKRLIKCTKRHQELLR